MTLSIKIKHDQVDSPYYAKVSCDNPKTEVILKNGEEKQLYIHSQSTVTITEGLIADLPADEDETLGEANTAAPIVCEGCQ